MKRFAARACVMALLFACMVPLCPGAVRGGSGTEPRKKVIVLGRSDLFPPRAEREILPLASYLASRLRDLGIERGEVVIPPDPEGLLSLLKEGKVDLLFTTSFPSVIYRKDGGARVLLQGEHDGVSRHYCRIFVRKDSGISSLAELKGRVIAFRGPSSTTGYFLPFCALRSEGLDLVKVSPESPLPPKDKVGYVFADDELNISTWVYLGKVDAGVMSDDVWEAQKSNPEVYRRDFAVLGDTARLPGLVISAAPSLGEEVESRITDLLLTMHEVPEGAEALKAAGLTRFIRPREDFLDPVEQMLDLFERER